MSADLHRRLGGAFAALTAIAFVTACGEAADANPAAGERSSASGDGQAGARTALPQAARAAWEEYARNRCRDEGAQFAPVDLAPLTGRGDATEIVERRFQQGGGGFASAQFNTDGHADFVVTTPGGGCVAEGPAYGDQGPPVAFVVSAGDGYEVFDGFMGWVSPAMIIRRADRDVLDLPGGFNGACGPVTQIVWGWTGDRIDVLERRNDRGQVVDRDGCARQAAFPDGAVARTRDLPPIETGYWAEGVSCAQAIRNYPDLAPQDAELHYITTGETWIGAFEVQSFENRGGSRYRLLGRWHNELGSEAGHRNILVNDRRSFDLEGEVRVRFTHCPTTQIPHAIRADYES